MTTRNDIRPLIDDLRRGGHGTFAAKLGEAMLNCDHGFYLATRLIEARGEASDKNIGLLKQAFPDIWAVFDMTEEQRIERLLETFVELLNDVGPGAVA